MPSVPQVSGGRVVRALERAGWHATPGGRHTILRRIDADGQLFGPRIPMPMHGGHPIKARTLLAILAAAGLTIQEFRALL
jgi:predicted RNA binding protein YcfA (HicA-like mRNA interferase family)